VRASIRPEKVLAQHQEILRQLSAQEASLTDALISESVAECLDGELSQNDWDIADLVDKIFAPVEQRQVAADLKSLVNQLRLPLFTVLLSDQTFLQDKNHVARSLLNDFMALATADRVSSKNLEKLLKQVVEELTSSGEMSADLLASLAERLNKLVKRQQMAFDRNAERIARTYDGHDRLVSARRAITRRINTLLGGKQVPDVILELLDAGWEHAMVLGLLKEGGDSETVVENFAVLEQLFLWFSADADEDLIFEKEIESPALLEQIERELTSGADPNRVRHVLKSLENLLYHDAETSYTFVESYFSGDDPGLPEVSLEERIDDRWQERAHQLEVGEWVELVTKSGIQRMRLVWIGEDAFKFVFLTPKGMHEAHFDYAELVTKLQDGELVRVDQGEIPFVDQSLYGIVEDLYQKMAVQAVHDSLTGCMQRRELEKKLNYTIEKTKYTREPAALIVFDIDRFNVINSNQGTQAGDQVLRNFSVLVDSWLQGHDFEFQLGRIAGNEFALIVGPLEADLAIEIADAVRLQFANHKFSNNGQTFSATLSSGVVIIDERSADAGVLLNHGALVCKSVKKSGGNGTLVYSSVDSDQAHQQDVLRWLALIEESLKDQNLFLRAQLISPLANNSLPLYEILLGVRDEKGDIVSPAAFIEAGETYNKSVQIDTWVVTEAIDWMRSNPLKLKKIGAFTINLSGRSLSDNDFMEFLEQEFLKGGFPAEKICFEVTETSAVVNINYTADFMREIKRSGCRFALDDFGTGFSSYAYLQKLPVDFLKVDGVFVSDLHKNVTNYAMVKSISELGQFLKIYTIAECVEEQAGLDALKKIGVNYVQGYLLGKPELLADL
jgi:diguanylate cyclase (GGDEF)-like protein